MIRSMFSKPNFVAMYITKTGWETLKMHQVKGLRTEIRIQQDSILRY